MLLVKLKSLRYHLISTCKRETLIVIKCKDRDYYNELPEEKAVRGISLRAAVLPLGDVKFVALWLKILYFFKPRILQTTCKTDLACASTKKLTNKRIWGYVR
jgi:hypothetical protein